MTRRAPILRRPLIHGSAPPGALSRRADPFVSRCRCGGVLVVAMTAGLAWLAGGPVPPAAGQTVGRSADPPPIDPTPLFTPGPGSVGAASVLESPVPAADVDPRLRQGWNVGGLLDLDASTSRRGASGGPATVDALSGTEFEEMSAASPTRRDGPASGQPPRRRDDRAPTTSAPDSGPAPGPRAVVASPDDTPDPALTGDCGWLGLGCLSGGMWALIGGLGAVGAALVALIVRELYFAR